MLQPRIAQRPTVTKFGGAVEQRDGSVLIGQWIIETDGLNSIDDMLVSVEIGGCQMDGGKLVTEIFGETGSYVMSRSTLRENLFNADTKDDTTERDLWTIFPDAHLKYPSTDVYINFIVYPPAGSDCTTKKIVESAEVDFTMIYLSSSEAPFVKKDR